VFISHFPGDSNGPSGEAFVNQVIAATMNGLAPINAERSRATYQPCLGSVSEPSSPTDRSLTVIPKRFRSGSSRDICNSSRQW
jgi:hypothetical protein